MSRQINLDPITRIEGHLGVKLEVEANVVTEARCEGLMFRGFESIMRGRSPRDAQVITQRICGVCPISHGTASIFAQEDAFGIHPPTNGRLMRNLILAANYLQSHIVHFYALAALDFVDVQAVLSYAGEDAGLRRLRSWVEQEVRSGGAFQAAPFLPRYQADYIADAAINHRALRNYLTALDMRRLAHQMAAIWAGKIPHAATMMAGGVTEQVTADKIAAYRSMLAQVSTFVDDCYIPDVLAVATAYPQHFDLGRSCGKFLSYGNFPESNDDASRLFPSGVIIDGRLEALDVSRITEQVGHSRFSSRSGLHPSQGETVAAPSKGEAAYSWIKAPRYGELPMEVGPLARVLVAYQSGRIPALNQEVDRALAQLARPISALDSAMGRHLVRALEARVIAARAAEWLDELRPGESASITASVPDSCAGMGLMEAPRGALGHWIEVREGVVSRYQCVVPTTWNCSPRDDAGVPGPVEQTLVGTPIADEANPIEAARIVRSFDPCIACAVH